MWYLRWISGESGYDRDQHTHEKALNITDFNQRKAAQTAALKEWEEAKTLPGSSREGYRHPELVWIEPLK